ncbi:hypothetical protein [Desulfovibrio sp.]|uniref:hypothetical protein n=1 Tax=Desulfovibrio sp. TaxID=885 RepID=UPI002590E3FE|nr:hypothetical protein [Desulfovibrio sp.]
MCDIIDERGVELADSLTQEAASHIVANDPEMVIATIDELLRLRAECARLEREAEWLANQASLLDHDTIEHWRDAARQAVAVEEV